METTVTIDGQEVKFRATAAIPRLYRIKFRRDMIQDMKIVSKALEHQDEEPQDEANQTETASAVPSEALELFENIAYIMAKHANKDAVPSSPDEWLERFDTFSIYQIFPVILALWVGNTESLVEAKKKLAPSTGR